MKTLRVGTRILLTIAVAAAALVAVGLVGNSQLQRVNQRMESIHADYFIPAVQLSQLLSAQQESIGMATTAMAAHSRSATEAAFEKRVVNLEKMQKLWADYSSTIGSGTERDLADAVQADRAGTQQQMSAVWALLRADKYEEAARLYVDKAEPQASDTIDALVKLIAFQSSDAQTGQQQAEASGVRAAWVMWAVIIGGAALAITLGVLLARSIVGDLQRAGDVARHIAQGRLANDIQVDRNDEIGALLQSLADMDQRLTQIVERVRGGANAVSVASRQVAAGNSDLSARSQSQASALEETAASMEEMTSSVKHTAANAEQANQLALDARGRADQGGQVVAQAVTAMGEITKASHRISDIIGVIDEIAFQTNLLALNAAVEAARAGEQGRGFAVVASEVRSLAQRSATAAREIKELIGESVQRVAAGSRLVNESGQTLDDIVLAVKKLTDIVGEITVASREQAAGIEQVNGAVTQMDQNTQQNAALVEESSAASASLEDQACMLLREVEFFSFGNNGRTAASGPAHDVAADSLLQDALESQSRRRDVA
ncbi:MAG: methyl-accepting chemotaxis protein [Steroidobacteraceae bacterium]